MTGLDVPAVRAAGQTAPKAPGDAVRNDNDDATHPLFDAAAWKRLLAQLSGCGLSAEAPPVLKQKH